MEVEEEGYITLTDESMHSRDCGKGKSQPTINNYDTDEEVKEIVGASSSSHRNTREREQCKRSDGKKWRCSLDALPFKSFCEKHLMQRNAKLRKFRHSNESACNRPVVRYSDKSASNGPVAGCTSRPTLRGFISCKRQKRQRCLSDSGKKKTSYDGFPDSALRDEYLLCNAPVSSLDFKEKKKFSVIESETESEPGSGTGSYLEPESGWHLDLYSEPELEDEQSHCHPPIPPMEDININERDDESETDPEINEVVDKSFDDLESDLKKFENVNHTLILKNKATSRMTREGLKVEMAVIFQQQKDLEEREAQLELEKKRLEEDKEKMFTKKKRFETENEIVEEHEEVYKKLIEKHKKETRELKIQLYKERKKLAKKHRVELEMHSTLSNCDTWKQAETNTETFDRPVQGNEEELEEVLKEKSEELESLEQMNLKLISMQREVNDEIQKAREAAMQFFKDDTHSNICVKRMGELCDRAWKEACKKKFSAENWEVKYVELFSLWQDHVRNPLWFPFKVETCGDKHVQAVDWKDEKLIELKESLGDEVCNSVIQALEELNEYNSSGRYPVPEIWNVKENRKATFSEVIEVALSKSKQKANKRRRV